MSLSTELTDGGVVDDLSESDDFMHPNEGQLKFVIVCNLKSLFETVIPIMVYRLDIIL